MEETWDELGQSFSSACKMEEDLLYSWTYGDVAFVLHMESKQ